MRPAVLGEAHAVFPKPLERLWVRLAFGAVFGAYDGVKIPPQVVLIQDEFDFVAQGPGCDGQSQSMCMGRAYKIGNPGKQRQVISCELVVILRFARDEGLYVSLI